MRIFLAFIITFSCATLFAQNGFVNGNCISKNGKGIENIRIRTSTDSMQVFFSEYQGAFKIPISSNAEVEITFDYNDLRITKNVNIRPNENKFIGDVVFNILVEESVVVRAEEKDALTLAPIQLGGVITSDVGRTLAYTTAASSNNELTSNYTVRGGN